MDQTIVQLFVGVAIAAASAWITVRLSRRQFQTNRWWERRVEAYERVIEAFHNAKRFASEHLEAEYRGREVGEERDAQLRKLAKDARDEIVRASDIGSFILSPEALGILARFEAESEQPGKHESWYEYLDSEWSLAHRYMKDFIAEAQRDLQR